jgi:hypothetical protein
MGTVSMPLSSFVFTREKRVSENDIYLIWSFVECFIDQDLKKIILNKYILVWFEEGIENRRILDHD